jgi:hypothetical protein
MYVCMFICMCVNYLQVLGLCPVAGCSGARKVEDNLSDLQAQIAANQKVVMCVCVCLCMYVYAYVCMHVCMYTCMYVCMCVNYLQVLGVCRLFRCPKSRG